MKGLNSILMMAYASLAFGVAMPEAEAQCGSLGLMNVDHKALPESVTPADVRKCAEHPLGNFRYLEEASLAPKSAGFKLDVSTTSNKDSEGSELNSLEKKACYNDAPYGCTRGYCWKTCGPKGEWCWTAAKGGIGSWFKCSTWKDCGDNGWACGRGCPVSCGCSC